MGVGLPRPDIGEAGNIALVLPASEADPIEVCDFDQ